MRTIKKLSVIFIAALILMCLPLSAYSKEESIAFDNLEALGITLEGIGETDFDSAAKRTHLAYIVSKLIDGKDYEKCVTAFSDVTDTTDFSGYINNAYNAGIFSGTGNGTFLPEGTVSIDNVYKVLSVIAGYETLANAFGTYPEGYRKVASQLGILGKIKTDANENVTVRGLFEAAEMILKNEYDDYSITISESGINLERTGVKKSVFADKHNISLYKGIITDINDTPYSASVVIKGNVFASNKTKYAINEKKVFLSETDINLFMYENAEVTLWVDNDESKIVHIALANNVEIRFTTVAAVNSDENPNNKYSGDYIEYIRLYDDKRNYKTTDDFKVKYNMYETSVPVYLTDKFVKVVIKDNMISYIESWDLTEGGLISEITGEYIKFISGDNDNKKIEKLDYLSRITVYKNSEGSDIKELRANTYFDYYLSDNKLVIIASEKKISDVLLSVSADEIEIGNGIYNKYTDIYVKTSSGSYAKNGNLTYLFNNKITAYFDASGFCRYISSYIEGDTSEKQFLGIIEGAITDTFNSEIKLKVLSFEGTRESKELNLSNNCNLTCGKTLNEIISIKDTVKADNVFEFILNDKDEITEIKSPSMYYGYKDSGGDSSKDATVASVTSFTYDTPARMTVNDNILYFNGEPITILKQKDGKLYTEIVSWTDIYNTETDGVKVRFYGDGGINSNFRLILISGATDTFRVRPGISLNRGIVTSKSVVYDDEKAKPQITVLSSGKEVKFIVSQADASLITSDNMYIEYTMVKLSDADIKLNGTPVKLEAVFNTPPSGWVKEPIYKSDSKRMFFDDGRAYFYQNPMIIKRIEADVYEMISADEISAGDIVCYKYDSSGIRIVIVE